ncbi:MAG: hypothetical protein P1P85_05230 [Patescibacteria group bacterium]|nr:hypothetical protein [Patescibacteria group bacterium]
MKTKQILEKITPEIKEKEIEKINNLKLPKELRKWVDEYKKVGGERDDFIWKWTYFGMHLYTLSSVRKTDIEDVCILKTINIIIDVLVDDIIDKRKNICMLEEAINCFSFEKNGTNFNKKKFDKEDLRYLSLVKDAWDYIERKIKKYPRYKEFKDIYIFDYRQFINSLRFSYLVLKNLYIINKTEFYIYQPANMFAMISMDIDLMNSPMFNINELGKMREVSWYSQEVLRIGNWISTWEREVRDADFTSGVFAYAIDSGFIKYNDLQKGKEKDIIKKIKNSKAEDELLKEWEWYYKKIESFDDKIKSVDVKKINKGLKKFLIMHLTSIGYK